MSWLKIIKFTQTLTGLPASPSSLNLYEGRTQTLSGFTKLRFVVPLELDLLKPFQLNAAHFVGFFASHLFTKASFWHSLETKNPVTFVTGFVPRTGIEPALPCDNQILSLARLPIPPSGQFASACSAGCNITLMMEIFQNPIKVFFLVVVWFYLQHCFLGNSIDLIHFHIRLNRCI